MIRKLIRQMLTAQILSALTVSLCLLIDNIIIGRYLGVESIAAYQLANPILLMMGALGIRLVLAIAEETSYIYSLNLNNLTLKLPAEKTA